MNRRGRNPNELFPPKFGFRPRKGVNYDTASLQGTLTYNEVATAISNLTQNETGNLTLVINPADIGVWVLAATNDPKVNQVFAYENNSEKREILTQNLTAFNKNSKVTVLSTSDITANLSKGDSNWIVVYPLGIRNFQAESQIGNAGKVAWYITGKVPTFPTDTKLSLQSQVITYPSKSWIIGVQSTQAGLDNSPENLWFRGLQKYLSNLIPKIVPEEQRQQVFIQQGPMSNVWLPVFTGANYDVRHNYESFEFWGDKVSGLVFSRFLRRHFPNLTASEMTTLTQYYMSKDFQPELAKKLGLDQFVRVIAPGGKALSGTQFEKVLEDVFEAFFGGLVEIAEDSYGLGTAIDYANNLMELSMEGIEVDLSKGRGVSKTILLQLFTRLGWLPPDFITKYSDNQIQVRVQLPLGSINKLRQVGLTNIPTVLAEVSGRGKSNVETQAAAEALKKIESLGFNQEFAERIRTGQIFVNPDIVKYRGEIDQVLTNLGYTDVDFNAITTPTGVLVNMSAMVNGIRQQISSGEGLNVADARNAAITTFLDTITS